MSWQAYVDDNLIKAGMSTAAILGQAGGVWATSPGFDLSQAEQDFIVKQAFADNSPALTEGIRLAGTKYMVTRADGEEVHGRKGATNALLYKTLQAVLVVTWDGPPADGLKAVETLAAYMKGLGF